MAYHVLSSVHVTEKATGLEAEDKYVFNVSPKANKSEIKKAVQNLYGVNVKNVRIINIPRKQRRLGKQKGWRKGYKKAIVRIDKGQRIEIMPR
ncbi:50S ribosomal protein L23 [Patescibacteria group bacterium]|nr:50S ribosomal protein L23 [Patescibacteria group bacterium]